MSQRITLITLCVMAVACLAAVSLAWNAVTESRELNTAILENLTALANRQNEQPQSPEWMPVTVRLVKEKDSGPPAEEYTVSLNGNLFGETVNSGSRTLERKTDRDGIADFGLVRVGQHYLNVMTPWSEFHHREHTVRPGSEEMPRIVCPQPPAPVEVAINVANPIDGPEQPSLWVLCHFSHLGRQWNETIWVRDSRAFAPVAVTDQGVLDLHGDVEPSRNNPATPGDPMRYVLIATKPTPKPTIQRLEGDYQLTAIQLVIGPPELEKEQTVELAVLATCHYDLGERNGGRFFSVQGDTPVYPASFYTGGPAPKFSAKPGQPNRWEITLPEQLVDWGRSAHRQRANGESQEVE